MLFLSYRALLLAVAVVFLTTVTPARAHVVPNLTVEAHFAPGGAYTLTVNIDPRTFMAADPTAFPPVPASWYLDQTQEQTAATHQKAREYLDGCLGLVFSGTKVSPPQWQFQAINGVDNTPLDAGTQEVHLLGTGQGTVPQAATVLDIDYGKAATTPLILLISHGKAAPRADVAFPGETKQIRLQGGVPLPPASAPSSTPSPAVEKRPLPLPADTGSKDQSRPPNAQAPPARPAVAAENNQGRPAARPAASGVEALQPAPQPSAENRVWLILVSTVTLICLIVGWRLLVRYRHHHRFHAKPRSM